MIFLHPVLRPELGTEYILVPFDPDWINLLGAPFHDAPTVFGVDPIPGNAITVRAILFRDSPEAPDAPEFIKEHFERFDVEDHDFHDFFVDVDLDAHDDLDIEDGSATFVLSEDEELHVFVRSAYFPGAHFCAIAWKNFLQGLSSFARGS